MKVTLLDKEKLTRTIADAVTLRLIDLVPVVAKEVVEKLGDGDSLLGVPEGSTQKPKMQRSYVRHLKADERAMILRLRETGLTIDEITSRTGISRHLVACTVPRTRRTYRRRGAVVLNGAAQGAA